MPSKQSSANNNNQLLDVFTIPWFEKHFGINSKHIESFKRELGLFDIVFKKEHAGEAKLLSEKLTNANCRYEYSSDSNTIRVEVLIDKERLLQYADPQGLNREPKPPTNTPDNAYLIYLDRVARAEPKTERGVSLSLIHI